MDQAFAYLRRYGVRATVNEVLHRIGRRVSNGDHPSAVHVEVSNCCNLRCEYCVLSENAEGDRIMSMDTFGGLLPSLGRARRIDLSGLAEPLMNKRLLEMVAETRRVAPHAHITLCSNLMLLTEEIAEGLVRNGVDELVFSLDGVDPALVDRIRRGGSLSTLLGNVRLLQNVKARHRSTRPVLSATVVLQRSNLADLPGIVELAATIGSTAVNVNGLEPYSEALLGNPVWTEPAAAEGLEGALRAAQDRAHELGVELRLPALSLQEPVCPQIFRPIVLADGTVVPCSVLAYRRRSLLGVDADGAVVRRDGQIERRSFGTTREGGLEAVWASPEYREFRARVQRGDFPPECASCLMKHHVICPTPPLSAAESLATAPETR